MTQTAESSSTQPEVEKGTSKPWIYLLILAPLLSGIAIWSQRKEIPSRADWRAAVEQIESKLEPGDRISWYPEWAGEGRLFFHGLPVDTLPYQGPVDLGHAKRLWLIGAFSYDFERTYLMG